MTISVETGRGPAAEGMPGSALFLGLAGAIPFLCAATLPAFGVTSLFGVPVRVAMIVYGAVILSFLGGIRWGLALQEQNPRRRTVELVLSVIPSLVGWVAVLVGTLPGFAILAVAFAVQGALDIRLVQAGRAPAWFGRLRILLTVLVVGSFAIAFSFGMRYGTASLIMPPAMAKPGMLPHGHPRVSPDAQDIGPVKPQVPEERA
jgi:hypothetical protein